MREIAFNPDAASLFPFPDARSRTGDDGLLQDFEHRCRVLVA
jgi:hypothetical protein